MRIKILFESKKPIYKQIRDQVIIAIARGDLLPGDDLPTVRQLAKDVGVNPMTINKAYSELKEKGFVMIDRRHGAKIQESEALGKRNTKHLMDSLEIVLSEAKVKGMSIEELDTIIRRIYNERRRFNDQ